MEYNQYLITCLDDEIDGSRQRVLANRRVFTSRDDAQKYCDAMLAGNPYRKPEIIACPFPITTNLRPDDRPQTLS